MVGWKTSGGRKKGREGGRRIINDRAIIFIAGKATRQGWKGKGIFGRRARSGRIEGLIWSEFWIGEGMGRRPTRRAKSRNGAAGDLPADRRERSRYSHAIVSQRARKKSRGSEEGKRKEATEEEEKRLLSRCFLLSALFLHSFLSSPARSSGTKLAWTPPFLCSRDGTRLKVRINARSNCSGV